MRNLLATPNSRPLGEVGCDRSEQTEGVISRRLLLVFKVLNPLSLAALASSPEGGKPSQALPRQLSRRESQAVKFITKVLRETRKNPVVLLAPSPRELAKPLGFD